MIKGRVVRNTGSHYIVETESGQEVSCKVKGNFRLKGIRTTNPVAVGDLVELADAPDYKDNTTYIKAIEPRRNYIIRRASNLSKESHIIAANIDCAMLVVTLAHPATSTTFIDRFLATAEAYNVNAIIVINKVDLLTDDEDRQLLDAVQYLYTSIGYKVMTVSAKDNIGIDALRAEIKGKTVLLSGNSGVGKSTIINQLIPGIDLRTAAISAVHDTGMHTTTFSELFHMPGENAGDIIDTPGIRGFGTIDFDKYEVAHYFREIFAESQNCRFGNCTHTHEPGCAVIAAVEEQRISQSRYNSYLSILEDNAEDKYRKAY
jgi:ribosome biogenesis GTPase